MVVLVAVVQLVVQKLVMEELEVTLVEAAQVDQEVMYMIVLPHLTF